MLDILWLPFLACVLLAGIHCYLGIHVLARGILFVDLALAQMAALGTAAALLAGYELGSAGAYAGSLAGGLAGAALFAVVRPRGRVIPQEAIIGILYGVSAAAAVLLLDRAPHGQEQIKSMLVGSILWVGAPALWKTLAVYAAVGAFHVLCRRPFLAISADAEAARASGMRVGWWDFLFYTSFALVITSSVQIAGVLMVFIYLVVPAVAAALFCERLLARLAFGWSFAVVVSAVGLWLSYRLDLPTGAAVVTSFGAALVLLAMGVVVMGRRPPGDAGHTTCVQSSFS